MFVSTKEDKPSLPWASDKSIRKNTAYCVGWVDHIGPGTYSMYDWHLDPLEVLPDPMKLEAGVGQGHVSPRQSHMPTINRVSAYLQTLTQTMPPTRQTKLSLQKGTKKAKAKPAKEAATAKKTPGHPKETAKEATSKAAKESETAKKTPGPGPSKETAKGGKAKPSSAAAQQGRRFPAAARDQRKARERQSSGDLRCVLRAAL